MLLDLREKSQYPPRACKVSWGAAPCTPSSLHLILLSLIRLSLFSVVLGPAFPSPAHAFVFLVSSALLASFVPWCLRGGGLQRTFGITLYKEWC